MQTSTVIGSARAIFTISLVAAATEEVRVDWATKEGTALAGRDYEHNSGTVSFAPGETSKTVEVFVYGRTVETEDRVFYVLLDPPVNALLADEIGACIIHVDVIGTVPVVSVIIPRGEKGLTGDSAYQIALNNGFVGTQAEWLASLRPSPAEIAPLVAPLIDAGKMTVTAKGTADLTVPDTSTIEAFARRIAYSSDAKVAFATALTVGNNQVALSAFAGDSIDHYDATGFRAMVMRNGLLKTLEWEYVFPSGDILFKNAVAGDVPIIAQSNTGAGRAGRFALTLGSITKSLSSWFDDLLNADVLLHAEIDVLSGQLTDMAKLIPFETPEKYGYLPTNSLAARTKAVQDTFDAANISKLPVLLSKFYGVSKIYLDTHTEYPIYGSGSITGVSSVAQDYVLGLRNCTGLKSASSIAISGDGTTKYGAGVKILASGNVTDGQGVVHLLGSSLINLDFRVANVQLGWSFGDGAWPDNLLSEIVIRDGYTYNTPIPAQLVGSQCVVEFACYELVSNGVGALAASLHAAAWVYGSHLKITGGELMKAGVPSGFGLVSSPINSNAFDKAYGIIDMNGTSFECASSLFLAYNPNGVAAKPGSGGLTMSQCRGFNNTAESPLQGAADFSGRVVIDGTCQFHRAADTSLAVADFLGAAILDIHPDVFDSHWRRGMNGITGGVLRFPHQQILEVSNLNGSFAGSGSATLLRFQSVAAGGQNNRFYSCWNTANALFTVPTGGLKGLTIQLNVDTLAARPDSQFEVIVDGAIAKGAFQFAGHYVQQTCFVGDLLAGQTVGIRFTNLNNSFNWGTSAYDKMIFMAQN